MSDRLPVAVDAMGGDEAPAAIVEGAKIAVHEYGVPVLLVGQPDAIGPTGGIPVLEASEVIPMDAIEPAAQVRKLKDSSVVRGAEAVRDGAASSFLSAGNTGAAMAASLLRMGRIKGVARPAIAVPFPVLGSTDCTLLDCGANADCQPEWLVQFAKMGTAYARTRSGIEAPRVGVMTIGEEAGKGNSLVKAACELFEQTDWAAECGAEFVGNVEGRDLMTGVADVIVCDGFTGNVILKSLEGGIGIAFDAIKGALRSTPDVAATADVVDPAITPVIDALDPDLRGSAILLGTRGVSMISHGSSSSSAIANAIRTADDMVAARVIDNVRSVFARP